MRASLDNFLLFIKSIVTGANAGVSVGSTSAPAADGGYKIDTIGNLSDITNLVSGTTLTTTDSGLIPVLSTTATDTGIGIFSVPVPRDYDEATDNFTVRLIVAYSGTGTITMTGQPVILALGGSPVTGTTVNGTAEFSTTTLALGAGPQVVEFVFNGLGLTRDSIIAVTLAYVGTTSAAPLIYMVEANYNSCLVSYNEMTTGADSVTGNPLR